MKAYSAAQVSQNSLDMLAHFIKKDELHITTFFDPTGKIVEMNTPEFTTQKATVTKISEWTVGNSLYIVAEFENCQWSKDINKYYKSQGLVEDLEHKPHITLAKDASIGDSLKYSFMIGMEFEFNEHKVKILKK